MHTHTHTHTFTQYPHPPTHNYTLVYTYMHAHALSHMNTQLTTHTRTHTHTVLPYLLPLVVTPDPWLRHGALHAVYQVTSSLHILRSSQLHPSTSPPPPTLTDILGERLVQGLTDVVPQVWSCDCHMIYTHLPCTCVYVCICTYMYSMYMDM